MEPATIIVSTMCLILLMCTWVFLGIIWRNR